MTNEEIRAIALEVAKEVNGVYDPRLAEGFVEFASRFLAAIAEKAEPVVGMHKSGALGYWKKEWEGRPEYAGWQPLYTHPAIEPKYAPRYPWHLTEDDYRPPVGAAPLPDEVAQMVERLRRRSTFDYGITHKETLNEAADLIEHLARQVPPDCVVVPRELLEGLCKYRRLHTVEGVVYSQGSHRELLGLRQT